MSQPSHLDQFRARLSEKLAVLSEEELMSAFKKRYRYKDAIPQASSQSRRRAYLNSVSQNDYRPAKPSSGLPQQVEAILFFA